MSDPNDNWQNCECQKIERTDFHAVKVGTDSYETHHHPDCPHFNDSLIDVWKISDGSTFCIVDNETDAREMAGIEASGETSLKTTKEKMHREVREALPEFDGF